MPHIPCYTLSLTQLTRADLPQAGGKGANLGALIAAGLPVPPGFCVLTPAYREFVATNHLQERILSQVAAIQPDQLSALEAASAAIQALFLAGHMPEPIIEQILAAYRALFTDAVAPGPVAVRSSATAEDLPDLSFAGQQDTYLNIQGEAAVLDAVRRCWASLWTARAIGYRARNAIPQDEVALSVVVQMMVPSAASGVLFTVNPLTGQRDQTVIDATLGLGEALVSGMVEPDHYIVESTTGRILEKTLGAKALSIRGQDGGGTQVLQEDAAARQALPDEQIRWLVELGQRSAQYFGSPQDMEWAVAENQVWVVQSRPVTSLYPLPEGLPAEPLQVLYSFGAWQGMLDPYHPLGQDVFTGLVAGMSRRFGGDLSMRNQTVFYAAGERLFLNITALFRNPAARNFMSIFLGSIDPLSAAAIQTLQVDPRLALHEGRPKLDTLLSLARGLFPVVRNAIGYLLFPNRAHKSLAYWIDNRLEMARQRWLAAETPAQLAEAIESAIAVLVHGWFPRLLPAVMAGQAPYQIMLRRLTDPAAQAALLELVRSLPHNVTTEMDLALWNTSHRIHADSAARASFTTQGAAELARCYQAGQLPPAAQAAVEDFLQKYGMRGVAEIDLGRRRWNEDPVQVFQVLQSYLHIDPAQSPAAIFQRGEQKANQAIQDLEALVRRRPFGAIKARLVRWMAYRVRSLGGHRETPKFAIIRLFGILRQALLRMGHKLVAAGVLEQPQDIFFFHVWELHQLDGEAAAAKALVAQRRQVYTRELGRKRIPRLLLSTGVTIYEGLAAGGTATDGLSGSPVSPGLVEGVVHVVLDPHQEQLTPGEILVCLATDPAWTPLFLAAGGLVMEVGGMMTHGSVVAREYGIPAVVGVPHATTRLHTGQRIRVDGSTGLIQMMEA